MYAECPGAKFDAFAWLETLDGRKILFVEQIKIFELDETIYIVSRITRNMTR